MFLYIEVADFILKGSFLDSLLFGRITAMNMCVAQVPGMLKMVEQKFYETGEPSGLHVLIFQGGVLVGVDCLLKSKCYVAFHELMPS